MIMPIGALGAGNAPNENLRYDFTLAANGCNAAETLFGVLAKEFPNDVAVLKGGDQRIYTLYARGCAKSCFNQIAELELQKEGNGAVLRCKLRRGEDYGYIRHAIVRSMAFFNGQLHTQVKKLCNGQAFEFPDTDSAVKAANGMCDSLLMHHYKFLMNVCKEDGSHVRYDIFPATTEKLMEAQPIAAFEVRCDVRPPVIACDYGTTRHKATLTRMSTLIVGQHGGRYKDEGMGL